MSERKWTRAGILKLIKRQLPYLQANKHAPGKGYVWFGRPVESTAHWIRAHIESLQLIAAYVSEFPEPELIDDLERGLLAFCASHLTEGTLNWPKMWEKPWGSEWQSAWWTYRAIRCLHEAGGHISRDTRERIRRVVEFEADRFIGVRAPTGVRFDTKMEENAWDAPLLAWASFVFPDHPNAAAWERTARDWAFNAATTERDRTDMRLLEHQPVAKWYAGPTLHPDYACENHGTFHPNYQACIMENGITASAYELHGRPVPPSVLHNLHETARVLAYFLAADSTQLMVTGNDWPTFHGLHSCLHIIAHYTGDAHFAALAEANLDRFERLLDQSDNGHIFGSTLGANIGNWEFAFHACNCSLLDDVIRILPLLRVEPRENPPQGPRIWHYVEVITDRDEKRLTAAAWRTLFDHPIFTFLPFSDTTWAGWAPWSGLGRLQLADKAVLKPRVFTHEENLHGERFRTEGVVHWLNEKGKLLIRQELSFETKPDGSAHLIEKLIAEADVELSLNQGFCLSLANDLPNGSCRRVATQQGKVSVVQALTRIPTRLDLGRRAILDDKVIVESDRDLVYISPGERLKSDSRYLATQFDRVLTEGRTGKFKAGEEIRSGGIRLQTA
jgi:hypothetical protein